MIISFMLLLQTQIQIRVNTSFVQFVLFGSARTNTLPTLLEVYFLTSIRRSASDPQIRRSVDPPQIRRSVDPPQIRRSVDPPQIRRCSRRSVQFVYSLFLSLFLSCYFVLFCFFPISFYLGSISFLSIQPKKKPSFRRAKVQGKRIVKSNPKHKTRAIISLILQLQHCEPQQERRYQLMSESDFLLQRFAWFLQ